MDDHLLLDNRDEQVDRDGDPDLGGDGVEARTVECFDPQVLLDPLKEQLHLPTAFVEVGDGEGREVEVVGQKDEETLVFLVKIANATQRGRVVLPGLGSSCHNRLAGKKSVDALRATRIVAASLIQSG